MDPVSNSSSDDDFYNYYYYSYNDNDSDPNVTVSKPVPPTHCTDVSCVLLATASVIMVLGTTGNGFVIWIAGFKMNKTVNTVWYLSLAVSDFLFCAFLPLYIVYIINLYSVFGLFMCKFSSFILFLNMFSSVFLLVIISIDCCSVVMFPVWAQNKRTIRGATVMVELAWTLSAFLSLPAVIFQDTPLNYSTDKHICYYNYTYDEEHIVVSLCRFIFGFGIPLLMITVCYVFIIPNLKTNKKSNKPFKVMTVIIAAYFMSWIPYHIFNLLELNLQYAWVVPIGQKFAINLASANSCMNPLLYAFMGKDFKRKCCTLLSNIESTFVEDDQNTPQAVSITF